MDINWRLLMLIASVLLQNAASAPSKSIKITAGADLETITLQTMLGQITGLVSYLNGSQVNKFLGIPYGKPPLAEKRFAKTEPFGPFNKLNATKFGSSCVQLGGKSYFGDEDCLTLNIFSPATPGLKSVMVWIHGGGFKAGSGKTSFDALAALQNVVVVSINYRLNIFGFLTTGDKRALGNWALWDQHTALVWVRNNIKDYGGDSKSITLFGESAGGRSVVFQMFSPHNNLTVFQRAIAQSGSALSLTYINRDVSEVTQHVSAKTGCPLDTSFVTCLKKQTVSSLIDATRGIDRPFEWFPFVDNDFLPYDFGYLISNFTVHGPNDRVRKMAGNFPSYDFFSGWNDQEGLFYIDRLRDVNRKLYGKGVADGISAHTFNTALKEYPFYKYGGNSFATKVALETFKSMYMLDPKPWISDGRNKTDRRVEAYIKIAGDVVIKVPVVQTLQLHAALSLNKTFAYEFTHKVSWSTTGAPKWLHKGADHADELRFVFGIPFVKDINAEALEAIDELQQDAGRSFTSGEINLSSRLMSYWGNFAKTGNPGRQFEMFEYPTLQKYTVFATYDDRILELPLNEQQRLWSAIDSAITTE